MQVRRILIIGTALAVIGFFSGMVQDVREAQAIPAFARKYDFACSVCHVAGFPKLNDFGNGFRDRGYQLGTEEELPTWEGLTKGYWPVSFRTTVGYQHTSKNQLTDAAGAGTIQHQTTGGFGFTGLDVLSFGILARDISFGLVYTPGLADANFGTVAGGSAGNLESAFLRLDNLGGTGFFNLKAGKYELDLPFSEKRSPTLNTNFVIYHYVSGTPYNSLPGGANANNFAAFHDGTTATITNFNNFQLGGNTPGLEMMGHTLNDLGTFRYSLNALSNNTTGSGAGDGRALQFYGRASQSFGGYGIVSGHRVGLFGVAGKTPTRNAIGGTGTADGNESFARVGADVSLTYSGRLNVFGAYMLASDSRLLTGASNPGVNTEKAQWNGGFAQADYIVTAPLVAYYRYDWIRNTRQADLTFDKNFNNVDAHTLAVRYYFSITNRTEAAVHLEGSTTRTAKTGFDKGDQRAQVVLVGFDFAF